MFFNEINVRKHLFKDGSEDPGHPCLMALITVVLNGDDHGINGRSEGIFLQRRFKERSDFFFLYRFEITLYLDGVDDISKRKFGGEGIAMIDDWFSSLKVGDIQSCGDKEKSHAIGYTLHI